MKKRLIAFMFLLALLLSTASVAQAKTFAIPYGDFLDAKESGNTLVVKTKISPSYSNKATIDQNYYNACEIIRNGGSKYQEIQYWAVADMTDGSEGKVISFTIPKSVIDIVANHAFADNTLGEYVLDLWILPSLLG